MIRLPERPHRIWLKAKAIPRILMLARMACCIFLVLFNIEVVGHSRLTVPSKSTLRHYKVNVVQDIVSTSLFCLHFEHLLSNYHDIPPDMLLYWPMSGHVWEPIVTPLTWAKQPTVANIRAVFFCQLGHNLVFGIFICSPKVKSSGAVQEVKCCTINIVLGCTVIYWLYCVSPCTVKWCSHYIVLCCTLMYSI